MTYRISFEPSEPTGAPGRYRRTVHLPGSSEPLIEEITLSPDPYPGRPDPFSPDLHERPEKELIALGEWLLHDLH